MKELIIEDKYREAAIEASKLLLSTVGSTLGPMGKTVMLMDQHDKPYFTKDGVSVANALQVENPFVNAIIESIKHASQKTADEAGDGTTTSTVMAARIIIDALENNLTDFDKLAAIIKAEAPKIIREKSRRIDKSEVKDIAYVSANSDNEIAQLVQAAFNHSEIVRVEQGENIKDEISYVEGIKYDVTYLSKSFITNEATREAVMDEPLVLVIDGKLNDLEPFRDILNKAMETERGLVIVVEEISENVMFKLETINLNNQVKVLPIKSPGYATYRKEYLSDIAKFSRAEVITNLNQYKHRKIPVDVLGIVKYVTVNATETYFIPDEFADMDKIINDLIEFRRQSNLAEYDRKVLTDRINNLNGSVSVIYVGGKSELEMKERYDRIEDAVFACSSALDEGVVKGGGITLNNLCNEIHEMHPSEQMDILCNAVSFPYIKMRNNGFSGKVDPSVVDPAKVTRCAIENALSVAAMVVNGSTIVLKRHQWI